MTDLFVETWGAVFTGPLLNTMLLALWRRANS